MAEYLGIVNGNVQRLMALVNDLLDLSRIGFGRIQLKSEAVDLKEAVSTLVGTLRHKIEERRQSLAVTADAEATAVTPGTGSRWFRC